MQVIVAAAPARMAVAAPACGAQFSVCQAPKEPAAAAISRSSVGTGYNQPVSKPLQGVCQRQVQTFQTSKDCNVQQHTISSEAAQQQLLSRSSACPGPTLQNKNDTLQQGQRNNAWTIEQSKAITNAPQTKSQACMIPAISQDLMPAAKRPLHAANIQPRLDKVVQDTNQSCCRPEPRLLHEEPPRGTTWLHGLLQVKQASQRIDQYWKFKFANNCKLSSNSCNWMSSFMKFLCRRCPRVKFRDAPSLQKFTKHAAITAFPGSA